MIGIALCVTGCAGTKVGPVASRAPNNALEPPRTIAVIVENNSPAPKKASKREGQLADAQTTLTMLSESMTKLLAARQISAVPAGMPADLILRCRILDVSGGNKALRVLIGYGAGKAVLRVGVSLYDPKAESDTPLLSFETNGTTGKMPGPGFTTRALVGDGLNALKKDGLPKEVDQATESIDQQLAKYFLARNWPYPKPDESGVGSWLNHDVLNR